MARGDYSHQPLAPRHAMLLSNQKTIHKQCQD